MSHDPSEIIIICWSAARETFIIIINIIIINLKNSCAAFFLETDVGVYTFKMHALIHQGHIILIKCDSKNI